MKIKCYLEIDKNVSPDANLVVLEGQGIKGKFKFKSFPEYWRNGDEVDVVIEEQSALGEDEVVLELDSKPLTLSEEESALVLNNPRGTSMPEEETAESLQELTNTVEKTVEESKIAPVFEAIYDAGFYDNVVEESNVEQSSKEQGKEEAENAKVSPAKKPRKKKSE